jgi:hypothetical protein
MKNKIAVMGASAAAALVALGSFASLAAAQPPAQTPTNQTPPQSTEPGPVRFVGMVQSVGNNDIQLRTQRGPVDANVNERTWILVERNSRCVEGTLTDIQTDRPAGVAGMTTGNQGEVNARMVAQGRRCMRVIMGDGADNAPGKEAVAKAAANHAAMGTIKSISGSTIVLTIERGGEATIHTTANTVVLNNGFAALSTLKVGDRVAVLGAPDKRAQGTKPDRAPGQKPAEKPAGPQNRTINAWGIRVVTDATQLVGGRVESISGNTVTLAGPRKDAPLTVTLSGSTAYRAATITDRQITLANAAQADIKVGSILFVEGARSADNNLAAKAVVIMPAKERPANEKPATP